MCCIYFHGRELLKAQREVSQIVTPGTLGGELQGDHGKPNYLLAIVRAPRSECGLAFVGREYVKKN